MVDGGPDAAAGLAEGACESCLAAEAAVGAVRREETGDFWLALDVGGLLPFL